MLYLNVRGSEAMKFKAEVEERPREQTWIPLKNRMEYSFMLQLPLPCPFLKPFYNSWFWKSFLRLVRLLEHILILLISYRSRLSFSLIAVSDFRIFFARRLIFLGSSLLYSFCLFEMSWRLCSKPEADTGSEKDLKAFRIASKQKFGDCTFFPSFTT
jgi:hypothetical protein